MPGNILTAGQANNQQTQPPRLIMRPAHISLQLPLLCQTGFQLSANKLPAI